MNVPLSSYYRIYVIQGFTCRSDPARTQRGGASAGNLFQHQLEMEVGSVLTVFVTRLAKKALAKKISGNENGPNPQGV